MPMIKAKPTYKNLLRIMMLQFTILKVGKMNKLGVDEVDIDINITPIPEPGPWRNFCVSAYLKPHDMRALYWNYV